jgi:fatty acid desaturase
VLGGAVAAFEAVRFGVLPWPWAVPVGLLAVVLVGAGQHQLTGLAHEGSHHILFRNRWLNDLASDWFCMFPIFGATHLYRLQHLAHHQFVNDPDRDPDVSQLRTSGHWLPFPVEPRRFARELLRQAWLPRLVRFMRVRAAYNATGTDKNPYVPKGMTGSKTAVRIGVLYLLLTVAALAGLYLHGDPVLLAAVPAGMWAAACVVYYLLPADRFNRSRLHPVVPLRYMTMLRLGQATLVFTLLANVMFHTGVPAPLYYLVLWVVPLFTSFAFFMILRQIVQHGNADRAWLTNTRTFLVGRAIRLAVFPMGQDYHLPHHMYATVPHYRLRALHEFLLRYDEYRKEAVVVEGYFRPPAGGGGRPTVVDVLGPRYAARRGEIHIDHTALDADRVDEPEAIAREEAAAVREAKQAHAAGA